MILAGISVTEANQNSAEWQAFINALTTNLTAFFREAPVPSWNMRVATAVSRLECGGIDGEHTVSPLRWRMR